MLRWTLATGFLIGLSAYVSGFLLKTSVTTKPLAQVADLLYTLGLARWTGRHEQNPGASRGCLVLARQSAARRRA